MRISDWSSDVCSSDLMSALGQIAKDAPNLAALDKHDHRIRLSKGITDTDFAVWKRAQAEDWGSGNDTMPTPEAIYRIPDADLADLGGNPRAIREQAATRLLGTILEETHTAAIQPGVRETAPLNSPTAARHHAEQTWRETW